MDKKAPASIKRSLRKRKGPVSYPCVESIRYPMVKIQLGPDFFFRPKKLARKRLAAKAAKPPKNDVLDSSKTGLVQLCKDFVAMLKERPDAKINHEEARLIFRTNDKKHARRFYDVVGALEGAGIIRMIPGNLETKAIQISTHDEAFVKALHENIDKQKEQEDHLDELIEYLESLNQTNQDLLYVSRSDLAKQQTSDADAVKVVVSSPKGSQMNLRKQKVMSVQSVGGPCLVWLLENNQWKTLDPSVCPPLLAACTSDFSFQALRETNDDDESESDVSAPIHSSPNIVSETPPVLSRCCSEFNAACVLTALSKSAPAVSPDADTCKTSQDEDDGDNEEEDTHGDQFADAD